MDTSYFFPDIQRQQLLGQQAEGAGLENQFNQSAMPLNYELLRQKVLEGQLGLAGAQQQYAFNSAIMGRIMGGLQPQPNAYDPSAPQQAPSATGGGGSSGGSGGNNASASPGTSPSSSVNGAAPGSQGAPGFGGGGPQHEIGSVLGMDPDTQAAIALINPTMGKQLQESRDAQVKTLQLQAQGHINDLETVRNAANPGALVMANPGFRAQWATMAPHFGIDPNDPTQMTPANVQAVFGALANQTRGQVGLPAQKYEQFGPMQTGAAGEKYQVESGSGKVNQVSGEALKQVVGPNGLPQYATADQAAGRQPFNPTIFGAANMSDNTVDTLAAMARANGGKLPASLARNPLMQAKVLERMADQAKANGEDGAAIVYAGNARKANAGALDNLTKLQTATNAYSDTLDKNLSSLLSAAKAAGGTGSPLVNRALRAYQQNVAGDPDTQQMVTYLNAVESEYAKLSSGSLGNAPISDAAKKDAKNVINSALTQGGFEAVADAMRREAQNKKDAYAAQISDLQGKLGASPSQQGATQSAAKPASQQGGGLPRVSSPADLAGLKSGDHFLGPDGIERVKH